MFVLPPDRPILVVDDNAADRHMMNYVFRHSGLENELMLFESGALVFAYMAEVAAGNQPFPALMFLDINMPCVSGFDILRQLRADPAFAALPIIVMLSSSDAHDDKIQAEALGASKYLAKPSGLNDFISLVEDNFKN